MLRITLILLAAAAPLSAQTPACTESPRGFVRTHRLAVTAGEYLLTMVATEGSQSGRRADGVLVLERSRARDGRRVALGRSEPDTLEHPLVGFTQIDLASVGAPMAPADDRLHPAPTSRSRRLPGVLLDFAAPEGDSLGRLTVLIGTIGNRRDGSVWLDGAGISLDLSRVDPDGFAGRWGAYGILRGGAGYFCARRMPTGAARAP